MKASGGLAAGVVIGLAAGAAATGVFLTLSSDRGAPAGAERMDGEAGYAPVVSLAEVKEASLARTVEVIGRARALKSVAITSEVTGLVEAVNIAPGQRVEQGDVLVQVEDDAQQIALARARAEYPIAKENAERYRSLRQDESASALEVEEAVTNFNAVQADLRAAEFAVAQRKIAAPFDGIAGLTDLEPGDYIRAGDTVTTLDDTSSIIIEFAVPQESASFVNIGQAVAASLTSSAGVKYEGEITAVDSRVDPASRTLRVEARVDNEQGRLIPGAVLAVSTTAKGEPAVAAPGLAVQWDRAGAYVWRRSEDGVAERAGIVILQRTDETVLVEGDLKPGDVIVSEGADRVRGGVPLPEFGRRKGGISAATSSAGRD